MRKRRSTFLRAEASGPNGARHRDRRALAAARVRRTVKTFGVPVLAVGLAMGGLAVPAFASGDGGDTSSTATATPTDTSTPSPTDTSSSTPPDSPSSTPDDPSTTPSSSPSPTETPAPHVNKQSLAAPQSLGASVQATTTWSAPTCTNKYVYSVQSNGSVVQAVVNAGSTNMSTTTNSGWSGISGVDNANGLAIAAGGATMYAYQRSGTDVGSILKWTTAGGWQKVANSSFTTNISNSLVTGAVNLATGKYMFGGYDWYSGRGTDQWRFYIFQYDPATNAFSTVGYINTGITDYYASNNGDMAFDSTGNLYVVHGADSTNIYAVSAANLASASGGRINATQSNSGSLAIGSINGIAFDADGTVYLGNGSQLAHYDPTTWSQIGNTMTSLGDSTDLASCNSPATLTIQKNVAGRADASDQFVLTLKNGNTVMQTATTTGSATGVQADSIVSPAVAGTKYTFTEAMSDTSNSTLQSYTSSWTCTGGSATAGTTGTVTIPGSGGNIVCTFTNTPLNNPVTLMKQWGTNSSAGDTAALSVTGAVVPGTQVNKTSTAGTGPNPDTTNVASANAYYGGTVNLGDLLTSSNGTQYAATYTCTQKVGSTTSPLITNSTTGSFVMPTKAGAVSCTVTNTPTAVGVQINKLWTVKDAAGNTIGTYNVPSKSGDTEATLPAGFAATPTITTNSKTTNVTWGATTTGFNVGQAIQVAETGVTVPTGCTVQTKLVTQVNGKAPTGSGALPFASSLATSPNPNTYTITNTVTCVQSLTLAKVVSFGSADPTSWTLSGTGPTGSAAGPNGKTGTAAATANVTPGVTYTLAEAYNKPGVNNYVANGDWTCKDGQSNTVPVNGSGVIVSYGQTVTCTIKNWTAQISVLKTIQGTGLTPQQFNLTLTPPSGLGSAVTFGGANQATTGNTFEVKPGATYQLSEASATAGLPFLSLGLQVSTDGGNNWTPVAGNNITATAGVTTLYRFVNAAVTPIALPLTGGLGTDVIAILGGSILAGGAALAAWQLIRRRRVRRL